MYGWRARIGVLYPSSALRDNDFARMSPQGVSTHVTRLAFENVGTVEAITAMSETDHLVTAARLVADVRPHVITWADTSGSFLFGPGGERAQTDAITKATGIPASTTSTAVVAAFAALGVSRVAIASPYLAQVDEPMTAYLRAAGLEVVALESLHLKSSDDVARTSDEAVVELARRAVGPDAEALFVPCTDFASIDLIEPLETDLKIPAVFANQATMWHALRLAGVADAPPGFGRLMGVTA